MKTQQLLKSGLFALVFSIFSLSLQAQEVIQAEDIMTALKKGEAINYTDVVVEGVLDLTFMEEKMDDLPKRRWWKNGGDNTVTEVVLSPISFKNVTFKDDVIAYYHDKRSAYTFTADFENEVIFENCLFQKDAMFKYSNFEAEASFAGSSFERESTFKYAEFEDGADFSNTYFDEDAVFKYTKFYRGANFQAAKFDRSLDMKYTKVDGDFNVNDLEVRWDIISKYAKVNGRSFTRYLLDN